MRCVAHRHIQGKLSGDISQNGTLRCAAIEPPNPRCAARIVPPSLHTCHWRQVGVTNGVVAHLTYGRATVCARRLHQILKGKSRPGRRRGAPAVEHRPYGYHPDRRLRRCGGTGALRSAQSPVPPLAPTRPPRRPLQLTVSSTVARRCASGMVKPAPGGQLTPWKLMASSSSSASSTGRCAAPSACTLLASPPQPSPHTT